MRSLSSAYVCASILALLAGHPGAASGELIANASFEIPSVGPTGISVITPGNEPPGFGWSVDAGSVEVLGELFPTLPGPSFDGEQHLDLNGTTVGTLSQAFTTVPSQVYTLSFAYANNYIHTNETNPASAVVEITDTGTAADLLDPFTISHGNSTSTDLNWTVGGLIFTAIGPNSTLRFASNSATPFGGILLDGVSSTFELLGDFDDSGRVGAGDLSLVLESWGLTTPPVPDGWINQQPDGLIGAAQLSVVLSHWGDTATPPSVPEPTALPLWLCAFTALAARRRSQKPTAESEARSTTLGSTTLGTQHVVETWPWARWFHRDGSQ